MNVKETVDKIKSLLAEAKPAEVEVKAEAASEVATAPVVFELTEDQYNAIESRIASLEEDNKAISQEFAAVKAENEAYKAAFAKHGEVVNQILELVGQLSNTPEEKPIEEVKTGFANARKAEKEAATNRLLNGIKEFKQSVSVKN
jgi:hypothetical protein